MFFAIVPDVPGLGRPVVEAAVQRDPVVAAVPALLRAFLVGRSGAVVLVVEVEPDLVLRRQLIGETDGADLLVIGVAHLQVAILDVVPGVRVAGVQVAVLPRHDRVTAERAQLTVEPQPVPCNRAAHRVTRIPVLDEAGYLGEAVASQRVIEVAALRPLPGGAVEHAAAERVPTGLRHHVEGRAAAIDLAEAAGHRHLNFRGVGGVVAEARDATAIERRARRSCRRSGPCLHCHARHAR